jgi:hypothetical protein
MPATACIEPTLEDGVDEVLDRHNAAAAFQTACEIVRSCFHGVRSLHASLRDDPDVDGRAWVILNVFLPQSYALDLLEKERLRFHEEMVRRVPLELNLLFGLSFSFISE